MYASDAQHPKHSLREKLQGIYGLRGKGENVNLDSDSDYRTLLRKLGDPHMNLPPVIHVAGTNGKGSVIATLQSLFKANGYMVHRYTSPHLHRFNERIVLAGQEITDETLETLLDEVLKINDDAPLTFFEITTALAFTAFARTPADIVLLETGLGGRLDCTNVIEKPLATIITRISYDHMDYLGNTIPAIAAEKAGIMKPGVPCIIGPQSHKSVWPVFEERARTLGCPLYRYNHEWRIEPHEPDQMRFICNANETLLPCPNLMGDHQIGNAGAALACIKVIDNIKFSKNDQIRYALSHINHPARLEQIKNGSYKTLLNPNSELWLDGGHNDSAGEILAQQAAKWHEQDSKPLHIVLAMMKHKDPVPFITPILPYAARVTCITIPGEPQALSAQKLYNKIRNIAPEKTHMASNLKEALSLPPKYNTLDSISGPDAKGIRVLVTGSLYLAGLFDEHTNHSSSR